MKTADDDTQPCFHALCTSSAALDVDATLTPRRRTRRHPLIPFGGQQSHEIHRTSAWIYTYLRLWWLESRASNKILSRRDRYFYHVTFPACVSFHHVLFIKTEDFSRGSGRRRMEWDLSLICWESRSEMAVLRSCNGGFFAWW